jgi:hypothetical protein
MLEDRPTDHIQPTMADLAQAIERRRLFMARLGTEYVATTAELRRWQLEWLREHLRERYPCKRPDKEAS